MLYKFHDLTLDIERRLLSRNGQPVKLTKLCFKVLEVLVKGAPALISHDKLIDQVWGPDRVISPDNLTQRMTTLRKSLGDEADNPVYIESVRGEGYRLLPEVIIQASEKSSHPPIQARRLAWAVPVIVMLVGILSWFIIERIKFSGNQLTAVAVNPPVVKASTSEGVQQHAIAILPFNNLSADPSNQYFANGIHDDLLTRISNIRNIKIISRNSVMVYRDSKKKLRTIASELGVTAILEGGVQRAGDQVRINLQLIDAESDVLLWAKAYTRKLSANNVFAVQTEITEEVAGALKAVLSDDERRQLEKLPTENLQALEAYFRGNQLVREPTTKSVANAIAAYRKATELDPEFSLAYSKLALALLSQVWLNGYSAKMQTEISQPFIERAIKLDPQSTDAYTALGRWYFFSRDSIKAEEAYKKAIALGPNNAEVLRYYGSLKQSNQETSAAIDLLRMARELDPKNNGLKIQLAGYMSYPELADEGILLIEGVLQDSPDSADAYRILAYLESSGKFRHDKAIRAMRKAYALDPHNPKISSWNAVMHWRMGDFKNATMWMNHAARIDTDSNNRSIYLGWAFINERNYANANQEFARTTTKNAMYWNGIFTLARVDIAAGRYRDALKRLNAFAPKFSTSKSFQKLSYGVAVINAHRKLGEQKKAQAMQDKLMSEIKTNRPMFHKDLEVLDACLYIVSGQVEDAIRTLEEWVRRGGVSSQLLIHNESELGALAGNPEYQKLMQIIKGRLREQKANLARWESSGEMPPIPREVSEPME